PPTLVCSLQPGQPSACKRGTVTLMGSPWLLASPIVPIGGARLFYTYLGNGPVFEFQMGPQNPLLGSFLKGFGRDDSNELYVMIDSNIGTLRDRRKSSENRPSGGTTLAAW